jgi:O-antigen ligase
VKWLVIAVALLGLVPALAHLASRSSRARLGLVMLLAFEVFNPSHVNLYSDENYRGESRGFEITSVDLLCLALALAQRRRGARPATTHRLVVQRALYLAVVVVSALAGQDSFRSAFSVWKLLRMYCCYSVLAGVFQDLELANAALLGLAYGVISQGGQALWQKYAYHAVRVVGSQSHPNSLAMIVNFVTPVAFALLLQGGRSRLLVLVYALAAMCNVFSLCRGGMMMFLLASGLVVAMSFRRRVNARKVRIVASLIVGGIAAVLKSLDTIVKRFTEAPKESELARKLFNLAARAMADEHPFGVGINMYAYVLDHGGYADRFSIEPGDRNGIAHHIYWLTAAETGYVGCALYVLLLGSVLAGALKLIREPGPVGEIAVGIAAGLVVTYTQGTAEWIARQTNMSYLFWLFAAMISAFQAQRARRAAPGGG